MLLILRLQNCERARRERVLSNAVSLLPSNHNHAKQILTMNVSRFFSSFLRVIKSDIEREKKGKAGVENLAKALQETPKFGSEDSQQDVQEKLQHMRSMLTFMEACR